MTDCSIAPQRNPGRAPPGGVRIHRVFPSSLTEYESAAQNAWAAFHYRPNPNDPEVEGRHLTSDGSFPDCQDFRSLPGNTVVTRYTIENW